MRRVPTAVILAILAVIVWALDWSISRAQCPPPDNWVCGDFTEPDSTTALMAKKTGVEWGVGAGFTRALTLGIKTSTDKSGAWMEASLERPHTSKPPKGGATVFSVRVAQAASDVFKSGYEVSVKAPSEHPEFVVSVYKKGIRMYHGESHSAKVAVVDEWPRFASAGSDKHGAATAGWALNSPREIHLTGASHAKTDSIVTGDQIRVSLEGKKTGSAGVLRLRCSPAIDSLRLQSVRAGLFNLAHKK
jgi:hypothetical protein